MTTLLSDNDYELIGEKIGLSVPKTKLLFEEEKDAETVFNQILSKFDAKDISKSSLLFATKIAIHLNPIELNKKEKQYLLSIITENLPKIVKLPKIKPKINYNYDETAATHNLLVCSIFNQDCSTPHLITIQNGFKFSPLKDRIHNNVNVQNMFDVLRRMNKDANLLDKAS